MRAHAAFTMIDTAALAIEHVPTSRLHASPSNPRVNEAAVPHVAASIARFGWQQPIVARRSGEVIAGNTRLKAAQKLGHATVPVIWFDGSDLDATAFAIADNKTHEFAEWDEPALAKLLSVLRSEDALEGVGFEAAEVDELLQRLERELAPNTSVNDPGPLDAPDHPTTRAGDLWLLGAHRLLCGDSTLPASYEQLLAGEKASLLATDPPYLVDYRGGNHPQSWANKPETRDKHWDDYVDPTSGQAFFENFLRAALAHCIERVPVYQWHATRRQALVEAAWAANGLLLHQTIIWAKARPVLTRCHYMWSHEPCFYGWREGYMPEDDRRPPHNARTVWDVDQIGQQEGIHPTQKPLELFERPIQYHTLPGELVLEPFSGSGTQLIAAERLGRRARAIEIAPGFVDAAVDRWQRATGKHATLEATGASFTEVSVERRRQAE